MQVLIITSFTANTVHWQISFDGSLIMSRACWCLCRKGMQVSILQGEVSYLDGGWQAVVLKAAPAREGAALHQFPDLRGHLPALILFPPLAQGGQMMHFCSFLLFISSPRCRLTSLWRRYRRSRTLDKTSW